MDDIIELLRVAAAKATPGPWTVHAEDLRGGRYWCVTDPAGALQELDLHETRNGENDARFIVLARAQVPALIAVAEAAKAADDCWGVGYRDTAKMIEHMRHYMAELHAAFAAFTQEPPNDRG